MQQNMLTKTLNAAGCVIAETALAAFSYSQLAKFAPEELRSEVQWAGVISICITSFFTNAIALLFPTKEDQTMQFAPKSKLGSFIWAIGAINTAFVFWGFSAGSFYIFLTLLGNNWATKIFGLLLGAGFSYCFSRAYFSYIIQDGKIYCDQFFSQQNNYFSHYSKIQIALLIILIPSLALTAFAESCFSDFIFNATWTLFCEAFNGEKNLCEASVLKTLSIIPAISAGLTALCAYPWVLLNRIHPIESALPLLPPTIPTEKSSISFGLLLACIPFIFSSLSDGLRNAFATLDTLSLDQNELHKTLPLFIPVTTAGLLTYSIFNKIGVHHLHETGKKIFSWRP